MEEKISRVFRGKQNRHNVHCLEKSVYDAQKEQRDNGRRGKTKVDFPFTNEAYAIGCSLDNCGVETWYLWKNNHIVLTAETNNMDLANEVLTFGIVCFYGMHD